MDGDDRKVLEKREKAYLARMKKHMPLPGVVEFEYHGFNRNEFNYLSPFSPHGFVIDESRWPTVLHYLTALRYPLSPKARSHLQIRRSWVPGTDSVST